MNAKQKQLIIELINQDCEIKFDYYCEGKTCALGKLALAAGVTSEELTLAGRAQIGKKGSTGDATELGNRLSEVYGLSVFVLEEIQNINDSWNTPEERRAGIIERLEQVAVVE